MQKATTTIRMGATQWYTTIQTKDGEVQFNLRSMSRDERSKFHSFFMSAYRKVNPYRPRKRTKA
jgi:hypothetical protein